MVICGTTKPLVVFAGITLLDRLATVREGWRPRNNPQNMLLCTSTAVSHSPTPRPQVGH